MRTGPSRIIATELLSERELVAGDFARSDLAASFRSLSFSRFSSGISLIPPFFILGLESFVAPMPFPPDRFAIV